MSLDFDDRDRESVVADLASADEDVRRLAVERMGALPQAEAVPLLVDRLGDPSWRVRKVSVERIVACPDTESIATALVAALGDGENPGRRNSAVEALVECGPRVVPVLMRAIASRDVDVRKLVVDALGGIGDPRAMQQLTEMLDDRDANVRAAAADALGAIGGAGVAERLVERAARCDEDQIVRFSALHALSILEVPVRAREVAGIVDDPILRAAGLDLLGRRDDDPEAEALLLKGLASNARSAREAAMRALLRLLSRRDGARADALVRSIRETAASHEGIVAGAVARLEDAGLAMRLVLVQFLGLLRSEISVLPILRAGRDEALAQVALATLEELGEVAERAIDAAWNALDAGARRDGCALFGRSGGARGEARLLAALEDPDPELRVAAARAIGRLRLAPALGKLVHRLESAAADTAFEAEEELEALTAALVAVAEPRSAGDPRVTAQAVEFLSSRLEGATEPMRLVVAKVLGCIGRREDTQLVTFLLKDPSALVRRAAVDALARLDPGTAAEPLRLALADESAAVRIAAAGALGASRDDSVIDDLERLAEDADPRVRAAAAAAAGARFAASAAPGSRARALAILESALADEALVALDAVETLASIGGDEARRVVAVLARPEPELVRDAVACIARHADAAALEALVPLVSHPDWSVRAEAIQALAERGVTRAVPPILRRLETEQDEFVRDAILRALKRLEG